MDILTRMPSSKQNQLKIGMLPKKNSLTSLRSKSENVPLDVTWWGDRGDMTPPLFMKRGTEYGLPPPHFLAHFLYKFHIFNAKMGNFTHKSTLISDLRNLAVFDAFYPPPPLLCAK